MIFVEKSRRPEMVYGDIRAGTAAEIIRRPFRQPARNFMIFFVGINQGMIIQSANETIRALKVLKFASFLAQLSIQK